MEAVMAATDQNYRNQYALDVVFGVSSILMLVSLIGMFVQDFNREFKAEQRSFRDVEVALAQRLALDQIPASTELEAAAKAVEDARADRAKNDDEIREFRREVAKLLPEKERSENKFQTIKSDLESRLSFYDLEVEKNGVSDLAKRYLKEAEGFADDLDKVQGKRDEYVGRIRELRGQADALEKNLTDKLSALKKLNDKFDAQLKIATTKQWSWTDSVRNLPIIDGFASPIKIHQITNNDVPIDYNFKYVTRFDRCMSCHISIDRPAYTKENLRSLIDTTSRQEEKLKDAKNVLEYRKLALADLPDAAAVPDPNKLQLNRLSKNLLTEARITEYAAHPRLDLFVGANSKHPAEKFGCSACHSGQGSSTSFTLASHTPNDPAAKERWIKDHDWEAIHMWDFPMYPKRFTESACIKCHYQVTDLYSADGRVEAPKVLRGYNIIREFGCFGCHEIQGRKGGRDIGPDLRTEPSPPLEDLTPTERVKAESDPDNSPGKLRKVGPSLLRISEKTNADWMAKWLRSPRGFRPDTKMPHFYGLSNNLPGVLAAADEESKKQAKFPDAEIWAVTTYLLETSGAYLKEAAKYRQDDAAARKKDEDRRTELIAKGKLDETEKQELDVVQRRIRMRSVPALVDQAPGYTPDAAKGRSLFIERGCLACHSHNGTAKAEQGSPSIMSEAQFGPNLSQVAAKLGPGKAARVWLTQWILDPHFHSPRSRMPVTHLEPTQAADIAEWLLAQPAQDLGAEWAELAVAQPDQETLQNLARVYLVRMLSKTDMNNLLKGEKLSTSVVSDLPKDEQDLANNYSDATLKRYLGKKAVARQGCYACHDIPGFDNAKPIGVGLNDWGKKPADRLAFEDIANFIKQKYHVVESLTDEQGKPNAHAKDGKPPYEQFFAEMLDHTHRSREGYLHQKLVDPRSYDFGRVKFWDDRARMPQFKFARIHKKPGEIDSDFEARSVKEEADAREAVMTFILGLVADQVPLKSTNQPTGDRLAEVKGRQVLDNFNCGGCHLIRPGVYDFKLSKEALKLMEGRAGVAPSDHSFLNHHFWTGTLPAAADKATVYGVILKKIPDPNEDEEEDPAKLRVRINLSYALRFAAPGKGLLDIPSFTSLAILTGDMIDPPPEIARDKEELGRYVHERGQFGGAFSDLLTFYVNKKNPKDYARGSDGNSARARLLGPPSLIGQGERTQPEWLYQFLLDPYPIRKMTVLRMPKFNMSKSDAQALVDYFGAVERMSDPGVGATYPFEMIRQQDPANDAFWQQKTKEYVARLKTTKLPDGKSALDQKTTELTPVWQQIQKDYEAKQADAKTKLTGWEARAKSSKALEDAAKKKLDADPKQADAKAQYDKLKDAADADEKQLEIWKQEADRLTALVADSNVEKQRTAWMKDEAYITDAYRVVMNRTLCLQCHSIGTVETKNEIMGPPLTNAHQRLRPGWLERWIAHPQRFLPYESSMPVNFPPDKPGQFSEYFAGTSLERIQAIRDVVMILPRASALPVNRYWVLPLPGEKMGEK
jgi:cbb3-type cytochrome oxidase cytochrome c subunit